MVASAVVARLHACASRSIPLLVSVRTHSGRVVQVRGSVAEVGVDSFVIRGRLGQRFAGRAEDVIAITRADGRPFREKSGDTRAELRDAAERHADGGGLE